MPYKMLVLRVEKAIFKLGGDKKIFKTPAEKPHKRTHETNVQENNTETQVHPTIPKTKAVTNKLLTFNWDDLDIRERQYFKNDKQLFEGKKTLLYENSAMTATIKSLHAKLKLLPEGPEMQETAEELTKLWKQRQKNWFEIDKIDQNG
jgi:hypothetical protein